MNKKIMEVLKGFHNIKVLKAPEHRIDRSAKPHDSETAEAPAVRYDCTLLIDGRMMPVTFYEGEDIKAKLLSTAREWNIKLTE